MKRLGWAVAAVLLLASSLLGQSLNPSVCIAGSLPVGKAGGNTPAASWCQNSQGPVASGVPIIVYNTVGGKSASYEYKFGGTLGGVSVTLQPCKTGGTCDAVISTYTGTTNTIIEPGVNGVPALQTVYDYFIITPTFTGGTSPTLTVNTSLSIAASASGLSSGVSSFNTRIGAVTPQSGDYAASLIGLGALANGITATTQSPGDNTTKLATDAFVLANAGGSPGGSNTQVQRNNNGAFGGITGATSDGTNLAVTTQSANDNSTKAASTAYVDRAANTSGAGNYPACSAISGGVPSSGICTVSISSAELLLMNQDLNAVVLLPAQGSGTIIRYSDLMIEYGV